jgi:hypothetical protein
MYTIVLAATRREAVDWAQQNGVPFRSTRFAQDASSLAGRFFDRIVELPSFAKRRDRFSINAAVKRLKRTLPNIPHEVLESFTPTPPRPQPAKVSTLTWLLGDVEAQNPFSNVLPDAPELVSDVVEQENPLVQPGEDPIADRKDMDLDLSAEELREVGASEEEVEKLAQIDALQKKVEADQATSEVTADVTSEAPKRRGRRTNEQKAYDEAKAAADAAPYDIKLAADFDTAYVALLARHPDDERIVAERSRTTVVAAALPKLLEPEATPGVASGAPDLDF